MRTLRLLLSTFVIVGCVQAQNLPLPTAKALFDSGTAAMSMGDFRAAAGFFQQASDIIPNEHVVFANLAEALNGANRYDEAVTAYRKAIELSPNNAAYYGNMSLVLVKAGKFDEGSQAAQKTAELSPAQAAQAFFSLGAILLNRGRHREAAFALTKSIEFDPFNAEAIYRLALTYRASPEKVADAGPLFARFLVLNPEGPDANAARRYLENRENRKKK